MLELRLDYGRILFNESRLALGHVVKGAVVFFGVPVSAAENVVALTFEAQEAHLLAAFPTQFLVSLLGYEFDFNAYLF